MKSTLKVAQAIQHLCGIRNITEDTLLESIHTTHEIWQNILKGSQNITTFEIGAAAILLNVPETFLRTLTVTDETDDVFSGVQNAILVELAYMEMKTGLSKPIANPVTRSP